MPGTIKADKAAASAGRSLRTYCKKNNTSKFLRNTVLHPLTRLVKRRVITLKNNRFNILKAGDRVGKALNEKAWNEKHTAYKARNICIRTSL